MNILILLIVIMGTCVASGMEAVKEKEVSAALSVTEAGKGLFAQEGSGFKSFNSLGISVNPNYQQSSNPQEIEFQTNHKTREFRTIDSNYTEHDSSALLQNMGEGGLHPAESFEHKTCRIPDETCTSICKRQHIVEIEVIPEVWTSQIYCPGHTKKERRGWSFHYSHWTEYCGGCVMRQVKTKEKQVNVLRDEWVACENEDKNHEVGPCESIRETSGSYNQTCMFNGSTQSEDHAHHLMTEETTLFPVFLGENPTVDSLNSIKGGQLGLFSEDGKLYCKTSGKNQIEIKIDVSATEATKKGLPKDVFDKIMGSVIDNIRDINAFDFAIKMEEQRAPVAAKHYDDAYESICGREWSSLLQFISLNGYVPNTVQDLNQTSIYGHTRSDYWERTDTYNSGAKGSGQ